MNPTILPTRNKNVLFAIRLNHFDFCNSIIKTIHDVVH
jgi:hypothetical protein